MVVQLEDSLTEATVSWTAPAGVTVGGYRVKYTSSTDSQTIDFVGETSAVITGENIVVLLQSYGHRSGYITGANSLWLTATQPGQMLLKPFLACCLFKTHSKALAVS